MTVALLVHSALILAGVVTLAFSIQRVGRLSDTLPYVARQERESVSRGLTVHRGLMVVFLFGYLAVLLAFAMEFELAGETMIGIIFLLGAVFVLVGVRVQERLCGELRRTMHGIVPICARCRKIRTSDADAHDQRAWQPIESYVSSQTGAAFSHGLCPECFATDLAEVERQVEIRRT